MAKGKRRNHYPFYQLLFSVSGVCLSALIFCSCYTHYSLTKAGQSVKRYYKSRPSSECTHIKDLSSECLHCANGRQIENYLRNEAGKLGANALFVDYFNYSNTSCYGLPVVSTWVIESRAYKCPNKSSTEDPRSPIAFT